MKLELAVLKKDGSSQIIPIEASEVVIGRSSKNQVSLDEKTVSRQHCKLTSNGEKLTIEDLDSTNGTYVEGVKVKAQELKGGEKIKLGKLEMQVNVSENGQPSEEKSAKAVEDKVIDADPADDESGIEIGDDHLESENDELEAFGADGSEAEFDLSELEDL